MRSEQDVPTPRTEIDGGLDCYELDENQKERARREFKVNKRNLDKLPEKREHLV